MGLFRRNQSDVIIDLTEAQPAPSVPERTWGLPSRCPECGDPGYLDRIDPVHEVMFQHCPSCFAKWETARTELESVEA